MSGGDCILFRTECGNFCLNRNRHGVVARDIARTDVMKNVLSLSKCTSSFSPNLLISPNALVSPSIVPVSSMLITGPWGLMNGHGMRHCRISKVPWCPFINLFDQHFALSGTVHTINI